MKTKDKVAKELADGAKVGEAAETLGVHRNTVSFHKRGLGELASDSVQEYRAAQLIELSELKAQLVSPAISAAKKVELALAIIDREIDLLGTKAPSRSISARIDASATGVQYEFLEHSHGLTRPQLDEVFRFMDSLPRQKADIDLSGFENGGTNDAA
jgi:hypothetical protein